MTAKEVIEATMVLSVVMCILSIGFGMGVAIANGEHQEAAKIYQADYSYAVSVWTALGPLGIFFGLYILTRIADWVYQSGIKAEKEMAEKREEAKLP